MRTKLIEFEADGLYGKAMIGRFDHREWDRPSEIGAEAGYLRSLLQQEGWDTDCFLLLDVSRPGPGAIFQMGGNAKYDLAKKPVTF